MQSDKLRVLWIGPHDSNATSGEVIYDRKLARILCENADVKFFVPPRVSRMSELLWVMTGRAWYRARYRSKDVIARVRRMAKDVDVVVCSWEPFDFFATELEQPVVLVLHNITSDVLPEIFPGNLGAKWLAHRARIHERRTYRAKTVSAILTLSKRDQHLVENHEVAAPVFWCPPGTPPGPNLSETARFEPELALSGTYGWFVKKRDLGRFLDDAKESALTFVTDDPLPDDLAVGLELSPARFDNFEYCAQNLRIGVIADRFVAGHKLKAMFYIMHNMVVFTYADISEEFLGLPYATTFVRVVSDGGDIQNNIAALEAMPASQLLEQFKAFRAGCIERFSWDRVGKLLLDEIEKAARQRE